MGGAGNQSLADDATSIKLREKRWFWYDAAWRAIAEDVDDSNDSTDTSPIAGLPNITGIDRHIQQFFGLRGINDAIYRREDRASLDPETGNPVGPDGRYDTAPWSSATSDTIDTGIYQLADPQGSVVATLFDNGTVHPRLVDEVEYEPYGKARRTQQGDFNHSGGYTVQDIFDFIAARSALATPADINESGDVTVQDQFDFLEEALAGETTPPDRISGWSVFGIIDNPYGYCGYYSDSETAAARVLGPGGGALYSVRFRVYDPVAGRWLTRDPAGFVDGANLYEYCGGRSISCWDPLGLASCKGQQDPSENERKKFIYDYLTKDEDGNARSDWDILDAAQQLQEDLDETMEMVATITGTTASAAALGLFAAELFGPAAVELAMQGLSAAAGAVADAAAATATAVDSAVASTVAAGDELTLWLLTRFGPERLLALAQLAYAVADESGAGGGLGGSAGKPGTLVHLTDAAGETGIAAQGTLKGARGIFAVPSTVAAESTLTKVLRTGLPPNRTTNVVSIPESAAELFTRPTPIGPYSAWKYLGGVRYAPAGNLNMATGALTPGSSAIGPRTLIYGPDAVFWAFGAGLYFANE